MCTPLFVTHEICCYKMCLYFGLMSTFGQAVSLAGPFFHVVRYLTKIELHTTSFHACKRHAFKIIMCGIYVSNSQSFYNKRASD